MTEDKSKADAADQEHRTPHGARIPGFNAEAQVRHGDVINLHAGISLGTSVVIGLIVTAVTAVIAVLALSSRICPSGTNCCAKHLGSWCYGTCSKSC
jgi:hypothetical protein